MVDFGTGLDLPGVGLVLQLGAPRKAGKAGTVDAALYAHRCGRAARRGEVAGRCVTAFDPSAEIKTPACLFDAFSLCAS